MADRLTVIECTVDTGSDGYTVLLSNGEVKTTQYAYPVGAEYERSTDEEHATIVKLRLDNAMLARGLDDANATIAGMSTEIENLKHDVERLLNDPAQLKAPASLTNVMTRDVADLPPLASLQPAPTMSEKPGKASLSDEEAVERHLAVKALAKTVHQEIEIHRALPPGTKFDDDQSSEGTKA